MHNKYCDCTSEVVCYSVIRISCVDSINKSQETGRMSPLSSALHCTRSSQLEGYNAPPSSREYANFGCLFSEKIVYSQSACEKKLLLSAAFKSMSSSKKKLERQRVIRKHSEDYTYFCGYCTVGSDSFDDTVNHVIKIHGDSEVKIRKRTFNEKTQTFEHHFKQWKIHPHEEDKKGYKIKINNETEQISLLKV